MHPGPSRRVCNILGKVLAGAVLLAAALAHGEDLRYELDYRFRLDPAARWADGSEITPDDVIATRGREVVAELKGVIDRVAYVEVQLNRTQDTIKELVHTKALNDRNKILQQFPTPSFRMMRENIQR